MDWISVKDRLPSKGQVADIWAFGMRLTDYEYIRNYNNIEGNDFFEPIEGGVSCVRDATHWIPLLKPPKQ